MKNKAFTLIELLVVVLIIGILAAIALPQYQTAVNKSRYAGLMPLAKAVKDAEEEMLMSKGDYTADLRDLSIQVPGTISQSGNTATVGNGTTIEVYSEGTQDFVKVSRENLPNTYVMYFNKSGNFAGGIHCEAAKSGDTVDKRAKQLCESLGGQQLAGTGTSADYVTYVLEGPTTGTGSGASSSNAYNWEADEDGFTYTAYDENGNVLASRGDCNTETDVSQCYVGLDYFYENGNITSVRMCAGGYEIGIINADGSCKFGYDDTYGMEYAYDSTEYTVSYWNPDTEEDEEQIVNATVIKSACANYTNNTCTNYGEMRQVSSEHHFVRSCETINGTVCNEWSDWYFDPDMQPLQYS